MYRSTLVTVTLFLLVLSGSSGPLWAHEPTTLDALRTIVDAPAGTGAMALEGAAKDDAGRRLHLIHGDLGPDRILISWEGRVHVYGIGLPSGA